MTDVAIVGAGPSALAAALALSDRGVVPEILDVGGMAPPAALALRDRLADAPPERWTSADRAAARGTDTAPRAVPRKTWFGSSFAYADSRMGVVSPGPVPSRAFGGYSKIWGAAVLAPDPADLAAWPADVRRGLGAALGRASAILPSPAADLPYGAQMAALRAASAMVDPQGDVLRPARLAVARADCTACAMCLSGCPYGAIFDAAPRLEALAREGRIKLRRGVFVTDLVENRSAVVVRGVELDGGRRFEARHTRVFLAAGALATTRIVLRTKGLFGVEARLKDSQKILMPILRVSAPADALEDRGVTLAGLFVDPQVPAGFARRPHLQITGINPMLLAHLGIGPAPSRGRLRRRLLGPLLARLMVGWGGLHSDYSGMLTLSVSPGGDLGDVATVRTLPNPQALSAARGALAAFRRALAPTRTFIPPVGWRLVAPGEGNHIGAAWPMGGTDPTFASDAIGRPSGFARVHAVDASVFPDVPASTMLLLSMANADRIAREVPLDA
ncbi:MAG: hypothetical protein O9277_00695 [Magnetospirillum sp.]|nr:hypothetical protein [Magnetospirillum sp.]